MQFRVKPNDATSAKTDEYPVCFWKRVLLEMAGLENGHLEKGALGKG